MQLDELEQDQANTGFGRYLVWLKDPSSDHSPSIPLAIRLETCQMIGGTTLKIRPASGCPIPDIGFNFYKPFWGKGYANEATTALMRYFEEERGVTEVFGFTDATNLEANKLFGRLGFEDRGVKGLKGIREGEIQCVVWAKKGMNEDLRVYGIS
ncbi:hypothetical protein P154DRAFT_519655 [Amniculicola lignicola CBS 123094]|uniref:N-acetyltransferase domain-containing protein n=1 Tax=Amniculicola lignicola CBS 123094 TaxID=1392246 RepID=A0A6A5WT00_9PLEO|nr:hypothetical protein P154DRAFT_519655 [Amniculicola lignicola CBS 123094]